MTGSLDQTTCCSSPLSGDCVATDVLCARYVDAAGASLCNEGSTLAPSATCGDDDECSQSECCIDGETWGVYRGVCALLVIGIEDSWVRVTHLPDLAI